MRTSFMKSLFVGALAEGSLFPFPRFGETETSEVFGFLEKIRRTLGEHVDSAAIDRDRGLSDDVFERLRRAQLLGLSIPKEFGGAGLRPMGFARAMEELGSVDANIAVVVGTHSSLSAQTITRFGTQEQKAKFLPALASGEQLGAFALTEQDAGSDVSSLKMQATEDGDAYILDGTKTWVTNAEKAGLFVVFARTSSATVDSKTKIAAFVVERGPGVVVESHPYALGFRGAHAATVHLRRVRVPKANILGDKSRGFRVAMTVLNDARIALAAGCLGMSKRIIAHSVEQAHSRRAFGRMIGEFGLTKDKIAIMMANTYALECMTFLSARMQEEKDADHALESAACKIFASETLWTVAHEAMQLAASAGLLPTLPFERHLRNARANLVFAGTNEIMRSFIALSGMHGPQEKLAALAAATKEPMHALGMLSELAVRTAKTAFGKPRLIRAHPMLAKEANLIEEGTQELAKNVERVLRRHGRSITEMQYTQRRVANIAVDLYAASATIARTTRAIEERGDEGSRRELSLTTIFVGAAAERIKNTIDSFDKNDDELRKSIASKAYNDGGYPLDVL